MRGFPWEEGPRPERKGVRFWFPAGRKHVSGPAGAEIDCKGKDCTDMKKELRRDAREGIPSVAIRRRRELRKRLPLSKAVRRLPAWRGLARGLRFGALWILAVFGLAGCRGEGELYQLTEWSAQESGEAAVLGTETEADAKTGSASDAENVAKTDGVSERVGVGKMDSASETAVSGETAAAHLFVHVCGEVKKPGVYELPFDARVCDALEAAGGLTAEAAEEAVNQAAPLADGQQVVIPSREEAASGILTGAGSSISGGASGTQDGASGADGQTEALVNINLATEEELQTLPGIGEAKAADIVAYRELTGGFSSIEDIMKVSGIKDSLFNRIKDKIVV